MADPLSPEQREWVAELLQDEFQAGGETLLQHLQESGHGILAEGVQLPQRPHGTDRARADGRDWPPDPVFPGRDQDV